MTDQNTSYLIVASLGPVQSYISQARRTQDLWHGSKMLSHLAGIGAQKASELGDLIFPHTDLLTQPGASIPNRFMFVLEGDPADAVRKVETAIRNEWNRITEKTKNEFTRYAKDAEYTNTGKGKWEVAWNRQTEHWLEFYWAAVPYQDDDVEDYGLTVTSVNQAMAARKMLRDFEQVAEPGHKGSLTGEQEALHGGQHLASQIRDEFWEPIRRQQRNLSLLSRGERLSALGVVKRIAHDAVEELRPLVETSTGQKIYARFPSTSSVSAALFRAGVVEHWQALNGAVKTYLDALEVLFGDEEDERERLLYFNIGAKFNPEHFPYVDARIPEGFVDDPVLVKFRSLDGDWLYEDSLIKRTVDEYGGDASRGLEKASKALSSLYKKISELNESSDAIDIPNRPSPYLAILALDGDSIGTIVNNLATRKSHRTFSKALADFAYQRVPHIVEHKHAGRLIYSGGDDVLALFPVTQALKAANEIRNTFQSEVGQETSHDNLTASAGIAFVHRTQALQRAIKAAKDGEHMAKEGYGRDAVVVDLIRRSGEHDTVGMKWQQTEYAAIEETKALIEDFRTDRMSRNLPYEIERIAYEMAGAVVPGRAREAELKRVLKRRMNESVGTEESEQVRERWKEFLLTVGEPNLYDIKSNWSDAAGWTKLLRFIAQGGAE